MKKPLAAVSAALLAGLALAACSSSTTASAPAVTRLAEGVASDTCGWTGSAGEVISAADVAISGIDLTENITSAFGDSAVSGPPRMSELKMQALPDTVQPPSDPTSFAQIDAIYNIPVFPDGDMSQNPQNFASVHLFMNGLCPTSWNFVPQMWMETFGVATPSLESAAALQTGMGWIKENLGDDAVAATRVQDMLLYKRLDEGFPLDWYLRGSINGKNFILMIEMDGTVTPVA